METSKDYQSIVDSVVTKSGLKGRKQLLAHVVLSSFATVVKDQGKFNDAEKDDRLYKVLHDNLMMNGFSFSPIKIDGRMLYTRTEFRNLPLYTLNIGNWWQGILYTSGDRPKSGRDTFDGPNIGVEFWPHEVFSKLPEIAEKYRQVEPNNKANVHAVAYLRAGKLLKTILELSRECHAQFPESGRAKYFTHERSSLTSHLVIGLLGAANISTAQKRRPFNIFRPFSF